MRRDPFAFGKLIAALTVPEPDTRCPVCWDAEQPALVRGWRALRGRRPRRLGLAAIVQAALSDEKTWYERHREDWERTGELKHLERLLRHIA